MKALTILFAISMILNLYMFLLLFVFDRVKLRLTDGDKVEDVMVSRLVLPDFFHLMIATIANKEGHIEVNKDDE